MGSDNACIFALLISIAFVEGAHIHNISILLILYYQFHGSLLAPYILIDDSHGCF